MPSEPVLVSLCYNFAKCGNSSVTCNFRNNSDSIICLANLLEIFPLIPFPSDLGVQQHEERRVH